jgi:hypothetical protein
VFFFAETYLGYLGLRRRSWGLFQRFVSPTIAENLDEARGFGLYGQKLYESVMENARSKVVFSLSLRERNLAPLADWLYSGTYDPSRVKHELYSTKVMDYSEETREITAHGTSRGTARSEARGTGAGAATGQSETTSGAYDGVLLLNPMQWSSSTSQVATSSDTTTRGDSDSESESESISEVPVFIPIFGKELSSVQFSPLEEQRFQAEQRVMMQKDRHATARFLGMTAPVELRTPELPSHPGNEESVEEHRQEQLAKWPFVLSYEVAQARLEKRSATIALPSIAPETEPASYKRRVSSRARMKAHVGSKEDTPGD